MQRSWLVVLLLAVAAPAWSQTPTIEEVWAVVQQQQIEIAELKAQLATADAQLVAADEKIEATSDYLEAVVAPSAPSKSTIGGYGELHYNNLSATDSARDVQEIDFHRFVLFFGHEFTDRVSFYSEFELEHALAGDGKPGEVEVEQAFINFDVTDSLAVRAGLFLLPVGMINETHEPPTFYGVERNDVENIIIPTTWWEAGGALSGHHRSGLSWDVALHSGLAIPTEGSNAFRVRSGRQKVAQAIASDPAYTFRLRYSGVPGLSLAASYQYQTDASQIAGDGLDAGKLFEVNAAYRIGGFGLKGVYGRWDFDGFAVEEAGADEQSGWYIEPSYGFKTNAGDWGFYVRHEDVDGYRVQDQFTQNEFGVNYWPVDRVVLKFDYRKREHALDSAAGRDFDGFDLGVGYQF